MRSFLKNRILPIFCALSILASVCVVPMSAAFDPAFADMGSVSEWESEINSPIASVIDVIAQYLGVDAVYTETFWGFVDRAVSQTGSLSQGEVESICASFNFVFDHPLGDTFFKQIFEGSAEIYSNSIAALFLGNMDLHFEIQQHPSSGLYRIKETSTDIWVVNSSGYYPYYEFVGNDGETEAGDQWIGEVTAQDRSQSGSVAMHTLDRINLICNRLKNEGISVQLKTLNDESGKAKYRGIWYNRQFYADPSGNPYVAPYNPDEWEINNDRDDSTVKDEDGEVIEGLPEDVSSGIDMENMLLYLPDGSVAIIDRLVYDESSKTYNVDSHDVYNTYITYNYTYYINYTNITYIGQTEEFQKYEVSYELPDGRDSADLTAEDLEQLNLDIAVMPYGRSTKNVSLRSLYHFDGDTKDASYWNYCTDFVWNEGASLTYMDAGVFEGALYLDETEHDFTLYLPSDLGTGDFTLQFRLYQSHTLAPVTDSYISFGSETLLQWSGGYFVDPDGEALHVTPTGTYNEIALIRDSGTVYCYLNGVCMGSYANTALLSDRITFHFGDEQQTFKYFDELRVLNYALVESGGNYTPTAVPHGSNLTLVYPTEATPVADEYYVFHSSKENLVNGDFSTGALPDDFVSSGAQFRADANWLDMGIYGRAAVDSYSHFSRLYRVNTGYSSSNGYPSECIYFPVALGTSLKITNGFEKGSSLLLSVVMADGTVYSCPYVVSNLAKDDTSVQIPGGEIGFECLHYSNGSKCNIVAYIEPDSDSHIDFLYIELIEGTETDLSAEWVESVTPIDKDSLKTPTLAVRTDLEITSHQIGGVRPSVPEKGMVWALVENQRITSLQIYNGQAWEGVDGRIWTGSGEWIPMSRYNVITLQDMNDIVDATPDYEYIYTESGFWSWWQKSWNAFTEKLFSALGSGGSGGSTAPSTVKDAVANALSSLIEGIFGVIIEVLKALIGAVTGLLSFIFGFLTDTVLGGISDFFSVFTDGSLLEGFDQSDGAGNTSTGLPEGVGIVFAFFSGLFLLMPAELRLIMIFGIGLMLFLGVFKLVKS